MSYDKIRSLRRILIFTLTVCAFLLLDQITKIAAQICLAGDPPARVPIIRGWIELTYVENDAVAFGIGSGNATFMTVIMVITPVIAVLFGVLAFTLFKKNLPAQLALGAIGAGAVGNFLDRLCVSDTAGTPVVRDFVDLSRFHLNVCNIADFCITLGALALVVIILFIGPSSAFPLTKKWRKQAKAEEKKHADA